MAIALVACRSAAQTYVNFEGKQTSPIRLSPDGTRLFAANTADNRVSVFSLANPSAPVLIAEIPVGGVPRPIAVTRDEKTMFVALSDLHGFAVVDVARRQVVEKVKLPPPAPGAQPLVPHTLTHGLELTPDGEELWVTSMVGDGVYVYDLGTKKLSDKIVTGKAPDWLTFTPDGKYCCVSNAGTDDCSIIDTRSRREVARLKVGKVPKRLVVASVPGT